MLKIIPLVTAALLALSLPLIAQDGGQVLRVIEAQDQIIRIRAKTRHTTVIVLPATENVLDFVVGDSDYWHLTGAANLAFLKPIAEGVTTNVALVCASGRIYSFLVTERSAGQPHLVQISRAGTTILVRAWTPPQPLPRWPSPGASGASSGATRTLFSHLGCSHDRRLTRTEITIPSTGSLDER